MIWVHQSEFRVGPESKVRYFIKAQKRLSWDLGTQTRRQEGWVYKPRDANILTISRKLVKHGINSISNDWSCCCCLTRQFLMTQCSILGDNKFLSTEDTKILVVVMIVLKINTVAGTYWDTSLVSVATVLECDTLWHCFWFP